MAQTTGVLQVSIIQMEVLILDMVDVLPVEMTSPADKAMDLISFLQKKLSEITSILTRNSIYKGFRNSTTIPAITLQKKIPKNRFKPFGIYFR
jgi:hypothetical protein